MAEAVRERSSKSKIKNKKQREKSDFKELSNEVDTSSSQNLSCHQNVQDLESKEILEERPHVEKEEIEILVETLPEPPATDPEPPDKVEIPVEQESGNVPDECEVSVPRDSSEHESELKGRVEELSGSDSRTESNEDGRVDPSFNRSESFHSAVSSLESGDKNLLVDVEIDQQQETEGEGNLSQEACDSKGHVEATISTDDVKIEKEDMGSDKQKFSKEEKSRTSAFDKESDMTSKDEELNRTQNERTENAVSAKLKVEQTDIVSNQPSSEKPSDKLYPVLDKFMEQVTVSTGKLEVISCSIGTTSVIATAPGVEHPMEQPKQSGPVEKNASQERIQPLTREQMKSLYYNAQLFNNPAFIDRFIQSELKRENHEFYEIVLSYLGARRHFLSAEQEVQVLQADYTQYKEQSWVTIKQSMPAKGVCGDGASCKTTHMYESIEFHDDTFSSCKKTLTSIRHNIQNQLALYSYSSQLARLQVESYIHDLFTSSPILRDIPRNAPVQACHHHSPDVQHQVNRLRDCITVLFVFHRQPIKDQEFVQNIRTWTQRLVSALIRVASYEDHLFVLNHILRCPAGVGKWGTSLIQFPAFPFRGNQSSFDSPVLDHFLTCLATVLMPIKGREDFVALMGKCTTLESGNQSNNWIMVDSDGEEDEDPKNAWLYLHENDVVAILNQLQVAEVFKHVLLMTSNSDGTPKYDCTLTSESLFLKLLAFCTCFVEILGCGLQTYNLPRYKQLNKRIGRMIRMTVQYVSDHCENFYELNKRILSQAQLRRLQVEYNCFFQRCSNTILSAEKLGSWQFMTDMPYSTVSKETMWLLLWSMHQGRGQKILTDMPTEEECRRLVADPDSKLQLADVINLLPTSEVIFLLTALANMAQCRKADETEFIEAVAFGLFEICYVCSQTREACSKVGRDLLVTVANAHPFILSLLIQGTKDNMANIGPMALYLFQALPFYQWIPCEPDIIVLKQWLMSSDLNQPQNQLTRHVLSQLNWGVDHKTKRLFLPYEIHKQIAVLLTEAFGKFITNKNMGFYITESFKQLASAMKQQQTNEQVFNMWAWNVAVKLHLHQSSFPSADIALANISGGVPELANDNSLLPVLKGVKEKNSMACYMALVITKFGHSDADFLSEGLDQLVVLAENYHYLPTLHVLRYVVPLFVNKPQALIQNDKFLKVVQLLLSADESFMKSAKSLWSHDFPGPVTENFSNMILNQASGSLVNGTDSSYLVRILTLWIQVLTKQSKWYLDKNTCYVLDRMIEMGFSSDNVMVALQLAFKEAFQAHYKESHQQGGMASFVSWVSSGVNSVTVLSLTEKMSSPHQFGWLSYLLLDIEMRTEEDSKLWPHLRAEIANDPKQGVDQALKKCVMKLKLEYAPSVNSLTLYQWSKLAVAMDMDHPLLLLVWQKFFLLFLGRQVSQVTMQQRASIGEKFFESSRHSGDLKKMKKRLGETADFHMKYCSDDSQDTPIGNKYVPDKDFHLSLSSMYQTFQLWVQEPMLHDSKLYLPALPQQYQADRLLQLFQNQKEPWMNYLDLQRIKHEIKILSKTWEDHVTSTEGQRRGELSNKPNLTATERILGRLKHHEPRVDLPALQPLKALIPEISTTILDEKSATLHLLKSDLVNLKEYAKSFHMRVSKHVALDDDFCRLFPQLYYNKSRQVKVTIECKSIINPLHKCSNPAVVNLDVQEKACDEIIQRQTDENRAEYKQLMIEGLSPPPLSVCVAAVHVENAITMLVKLARMTTDDLRAAYYTDLACTLFFLLAEMINDDIEFYPPTRQFYTACIDMLGKEFIEKDPSQTEIVLQFSLNSPAMSGLMSPHFVPINNPHTYVTMYERLVQILQQQNPDLVFMLLTKFEIAQWLQTRSPAPIEVKRFVDILASGLYSCGVDPDTKHGMVFEIYCKHLRAVLRHNFPQNLNYVLNIILTGTAKQQIHPKCWQILQEHCFYARGTDVTSRRTNVGSDMSTEQTKHCLSAIGCFFLQLRTSSSDLGSFGLYPSTMLYVSHITQLIQDLMICFINKVLPTLQETNPAQVLDVIWQTHIMAFAAWIQPLETETSPLLPWIQADCEAGKKMVEAFVFVTKYLHQAFINVIPPYQSNPLIRIWLYFCDVLCGKQVPAHVTNIYNQEFLELPWEALKPNTQVLDSMMQLKDQNCPESFDLLASVVCRLDWTDILAFYSQCYGGQGTSRVLACVLLLLVQCYGDQKHVEIPDLAQKTLTAETYDWSTLTSDHYRHASNWFLQTCDPRCVLAERSASSALGLRLLKAASGFNVQSSMTWTSDLSVKRQCYIHSVVQLMCQCTFEADVNLDTISMILMNLLTEVETVTSAITDTRLQEEESLDLVREIFALLNNCNPENNSVSVVMTTIIQWLQSSPRSILLMPCVRVASRCLASHKHIVIIVEECIHVYFKGGLDQVPGGGWDHVLAAMQIPDLNIEDFLRTALEEGTHLLLYGYIVQKLPLCQQLTDEQVLIGQLLNWITHAKPVQENESKLLLLWFKTLELILRQLDYGCSHTTIIKMLSSLVTSLHLFGEDRASGGLLGAIGLGKRSSLSPVFRLSCRALAAMITLQVYDEMRLRLQAGQSLANNGATKQEVGALLSMKTNKAYQSYKNEIEILCDLVQNENYGLRQTLNLIHQLSQMFYREKEYLSVIHTFDK
ncbi:ectopic P granules protein 5 homolog [Saccostrea echinata]|uniref:ectopic P granules protein 5 homolog n=1 Tax=Saccostrea echinata TaxID=191078 RepID=UPI002A8037DD|nr:ectopic P granules protein 5 homolog [Saccostrea echinata]